MLDQFHCSTSSNDPEPLERPGLGRNCTFLRLPDGFVVPDLDSYEDNSTAYYGCNKGKKPALETWWGEIKCVDGVWSHLPQCIDSSSCITPKVPNAEPQELEKYYVDGKHVRFTCKKAYNLEPNKLALCENGQWELPACERDSYACDPPARIDNAMIEQDVKELYEHGEKLTFFCKPGYELTGSQTITCNQKRWTSLPECVIKEEGPKHPTQSEPENRQPTGGSGSTGGTGRQPTSGGSGSAGGHQPTSGGSGSAGGRQPTSGGSGSAGGTGRRPTAGGSGSAGVSPCGELPEIPHGTVSPQSNERSFIVQCPRLYKLVGPNTIYCERGKWTALPSCKPPCVLDGKRFNLYYYGKYLEEGVTKEYWCNTNSDWTRVRCVDGTDHSNPKCPNPYW